MRALLRRLRGQEAGFTLVEVIASVVILGIIMVPLGTAMVFVVPHGVRHPGPAREPADVQRLSTYFPSDVASVDADGVNPARVEDESICKATATEQSLITFRWDEDLGDGGQTVVRYVATGNGKQSKVVRRICRLERPVETVLAKNFGEAPAGRARGLHLPDRSDHTDCPRRRSAARRAHIDIHGAYDFHLEAQRRVEGDNGINRPPGAPTSVHACSAASSGPASTGSTRSTPVACRSPATTSSRTGTAPRASSDRVEQHRRRVPARRAQARDRAPGARQRAPGIAQRARQHGRRDRGRGLGARRARDRGGRLGVRAKQPRLAGARRRCGRRGRWVRRVRQGVLGAVRRWLVPLVPLAGLAAGALAVLVLGLTRLAFWHRTGIQTGGDSVWLLLARDTCVVFLTVFLLWTVQAGRDLLREPLADHDRGDVRER